MAPKSVVGQLWGELGEALHDPVLAEDSDFFARPSVVCKWRGRRPSGTSTLFQKYTDAFAWAHGNEQQAPSGPRLPPNLA